MTCSGEKTDRFFAENRGNIAKMLFSGLTFAKRHCKIYKTLGIRCSGMEAYRSGHNGLDSKSSNPLIGTVGSNPTASASAAFRRGMIKAAGGALRLLPFLDWERKR